MIKIRSEQMEVFQRNEEEKLAEQIAQQLLVKCPERLEGMEDRDRFISRILAGMSRARGHQLSDPRDLAQFVMLMFTVAPDFDQYPLVAECFADPELAGLNRMKLVMSMCSAEDWEEVRLICHPNAWPDEPVPAPGILPKQRTH